MCVRACVCVCFATDNYDDVCVRACVCFATDNYDDVCVRACVCFATDNYDDVCVHAYVCFQRCVCVGSTESTEQIYIKV